MVKKKVDPVLNGLICKALQNTLQCHLVDSQHCAAEGFLNLTVDKQSLIVLNISEKFDLNQKIEDNLWDVKGSGKLHMILCRVQNVLFSFAKKTEKT